MPHILIVDDDRETAESLAELAKAEGFTVSKADTLRNARSHLVRHVPDVLLTDLQLPDGEGTSLVADLEAPENTEVVVITGHASMESAIRALRAGATDYLLKRGHKRIAFLSRQLALPGDHDTMDAIRERMTARKLLANAIVERFLPMSEAACEAEVGRLLDSKQPPTGFICRAKRMADGAMAALAKRGLHLTEGYDIVLCDYYLGVGQSPEYVYPRPLYSLEEQGRHIARMLAERARGEACQNEVIPVAIDDSAVNT